MLLHRVVPIGLIALAACTQGPAATAPQPLIPKAGPNASVRVEFVGGAFSRRLSALFNVSRPAYVMVGHLGGDGVVRVLFPADPRETGLVRGERTFRTDVVPAEYDAAPGYWFLRPTFHRSMSARNDSYDGNGHGFVFIIASDVPLRFDRISEVGLWNEYELPGYATIADPRTLVRQYAALVSPSGRFTLDYGTSMSSQSRYGYVERQMDCAMLASYSRLTPWGISSIWAISPFGMPLLGTASNHRSGSHSCMTQMDRYYAYARGPIWDPWTPVAVTPSVPTGEPDTVATPKPLDPREGRRNPLGPGRDGALAYRPAWDRTATDRGGWNGERVYPAPSTPRWGGGGGPGTMGGRERPRRTDAPRESSGASSSTSSSASSGGSSSPAPSASTGERGPASRPAPSENRERSP